MSKSIILTTVKGGKAPVEFRGPQGMAAFYAPVFLDKIEKSPYKIRWDVAPMHLRIRPSSLYNMQLDLLEKLKPIDLSILHLDFEEIINFNKAIEVSDYFLQHVEEERAKILNALPALLEQSNWDCIILSGITPDMCWDVMNVQIDFNHERLHPNKILFQRSFI